MLKQSTSTLPRLSSSKDRGFQPRKGQSELARELEVSSHDILSIKWPGGYGKSVGIALAFKAMFEQGRCDRLLVVVANDTQRAQMLNDFRQDCLDVGLDIGHPLRFSDEPLVFRANRECKHVVFVTTIQQVSACARAGINMLVALMNDEGKWMVAADEYHHYAQEADWGESLKKIVDLSEFTLATSATPHRADKDTIFPHPMLSVSYKDAKGEGAVKPIVRRKYDYRIDYINKDREPVQFTAAELRECVGKADRIDQFEAKQELRYSSKYVLPILSEPIFRLCERRIKHGLPLQMLVRAMSCAHAQTVCEQIKSLIVDMDLSVDWIGTGPNGRSDAENREIKKRFCPPKNSKGKRPNPSLDILVQVGMADEGFDSVMVAEIVDLHIVSLDPPANKSKQFYKRGTRFICDGVELFINVGMDHPLAGISGDDVELWLDGEIEIKDVVKIDEDESDEKAWPDDWEFPEELPSYKSNLMGCELTDIEIDDHPAMPNFKREVLKEKQNGHPGLQFEISDDDFRAMFRRALSANDEEAQKTRTLEEQRKMVDKVVGQLAHVAVRVKGGEFDRSLIGDYKRRISRQMINIFGKRDSLLGEELERAYSWIRACHSAAKKGELPTWLR